MSNSSLTPPPAPGYAPSPPPASVPREVNEGEKSFIATWLLSLFLGVFGADRFYLGKIGTAVAKLLTLGGVGVWWLVDLILVLSGAARDRSGQRLAGYQQQRVIAWSVTGGLIVLSLVINVATGGDDESAGLDQPDDAAPVAEADVEAPADPAEQPAEAQPVDEAQSEPADEPDVPAEYASALTQAQRYSDTMHMSKAGLYDQLTSEYGGQFADDAAQYAIDAVEADWNANALATAENYAGTMSMSRAGIYDQLVSEFGEQFTADEAQYAIDAVEADWNANALAKAKVYQDTMAMSPDAIRDQLTSEYGEKFTTEEAEYAVQHLNG